MQKPANSTENDCDNEVDTSRWGNNIPRIEIPEGWQDHQNTQQLIRKYLCNDDIQFDIEKRLLTIFVTQEEWDTMFCVPSHSSFKFGEKYATDIEFKNDGKFTVNWQEVDIFKCSVALSRTFAGFCINKYILREYGEGDVLVKPREKEYMHDRNFSMDYKNNVFDEVSVKIRN